MSALAAHSAVISGASSGSRQVRRERFDFTCISLPHRNYASGMAARGPNDNNHPLIEPSGHDETLLAILTPVIWARKVCGAANTSRARRKSRPRSIRVLSHLARLKVIRTLFIVVIFNRHGNPHYWGSFRESL